MTMIAVELNRGRRAGTANRRPCSRQRTSGRAGGSAALAAALQCRTVTAMRNFIFIMILA